MKVVTAITVQLKDKDRYSIFVDGKYSFSLSQMSLLETNLKLGQEMSQVELKRLKQLSDDDKLYAQALRLVANRPKTKWEVEFYLNRKGASPALTKRILNKLSNIDLVNDSAYAKRYVGNRQDFRPASRRKILSELHKKHVPEEDIKTAMADYGGDDRALHHVIEVKRRQTKYQNKQKLMQYLARQGFSYEDIKSALD